MGHVKALVKSVLKKRTQSGDYTVTFHATNWESALSIASTGPDFTSGRRCLDFGIRPSFYVTPDVADGPHSVIFDEAENRLHAQKAIMRWCLGV